MAEQLSWFDVASTQTLFDGSGNYWAIIPRQGFYSPSWNLVEQDVPSNDGNRLRTVLAQPNVVRQVLLIKNTTESNYLANVRTLRQAMNPKRGAGILQFQAADGTVRQLNCVLQAGLEGDESPGNRGPAWIQAPCVWRAADPYWYDASATVATYSTFTSKTVVNSGDVEMWPQWSIHGPLTSLTVTNSTTGDSFALTLSMTNTDVLTIDTTPFKKTCLLNGTTNEYSALSAASVLFSFPTGTSTLTFSIAGTSGATQIQLSYKQRYLGV